MANEWANLLQGRLDLLILKALTTAELHGLGIAAGRANLARQLPSEARMAFPRTAPQGRSWSADFILAPS
jgi:hypothetical protein